MGLGATTAGDAASDEPSPVEPVSTDGCSVVGEGRVKPDALSLADDQPDRRSPSLSDVMTAATALSHARFALGSAAAASTTASPPPGPEASHSFAPGSSCSSSMPPSVQSSGLADGPSTKHFHPALRRGHAVDKSQACPSVGGLVLDLGEAPRGFWITNGSHGEMRS